MNILPSFLKVYRPSVSHLVCFWENADSEAHPRPELKSVRLGQEIFISLKAHKSLRTIDPAQTGHFT